MWDFLSKKNQSAGHGGKILNEREIQEKLYGKYRVPMKGKEQKEAFSHESKAPAAVVESTPVELPTKLPNETTTSIFQDISEDLPKRNSTTTFASSTNYGRYAEQAAQASKERWVGSALFQNSIFWKILGGLIALFFAVLILQKAWVQISDLLSQKRASDSSRLPRLESTFVPSSSALKPIETESAKVVTDVSAAKSSLSSENILKQTERTEFKESVVPSTSPIHKTSEDRSIQDNLNSSAGKPFSVQVCTYRLEADARKLVDRLETENFSAFYQPSPTKQGRAPKFYVVYLGREASYQDAQGALAQFKQSPVSREFPDAYIGKV